MKLFKFVGVITLCIASFATSASSEAELKQKLSALKTFSANFSQVVSDGEGEELQTATGKLYLSQPQKLYWESMEPNEMKLIADGETLWHVDPFVEQVVAIDQRQAAENHPIMLLAQPDSELWSQYLVKQLSQHQFQLTSLKPDSDFVSLDLLFNGATLSGITILDKMDQSNQLTFNDIVQNREIDQGLFKFTLPEGFDLDDQRQAN